jgi:anti-sigma regulatory factor (Ser/Thr protein kinase)
LRSDASSLVARRDGRGLTVPLIAQVADGFMVQRRQGGRGCVITMRFALGERAARTSDHERACQSPTRFG